MAAVTVCSDFGAQENKICHCFHFFSFMDHSLVVAKGLAWLNEAMNDTVQGHPRQVIVKSSDKTWSTGGGNGNPLQDSCLENPMNSMKRQAT